MRNLLRVSLQDALKYHIDKGLLCSNLDFETLVLMVSGMKRNGCEFHGHTSLPTV